ncbi:MAG TPA: hypothetical protein VFU71_13340 [Burkholderiaceae bacterium]|nr:hypothetical protein [Burkholderiaceae bacterium]
MPASGPFCQTTVSRQNHPARQDQLSNLRVLLLVSVLKLIAEIALMALLGQWLLGLLIGAKRESNIFYRTLQVMTTPFLRLARLLSPRVVLDRHVPLVAFFLLAFGWFVVTTAKINLCLQIGVEACK